jgi:hypothetical protein
VQKGIEHKAKNAFLTAEAFLHACRIFVAAIQQGEPILTLVLATSSAFSLEMFLKCLILVENHVECRGHDIKTLFGRLSGATQEKLKIEHAHFVKNSPKLAAEATSLGISTDLDYLLERGRNAFVEFRYAHEELPTNTVWGLNGLIKCVREHILTLRPEWAALLPLAPRNYIRHIAIVILSGMQNDSTAIYGAPSSNARCWRKAISLQPAVFDLLG